MVYCLTLWLVGFLLGGAVCVPFVGARQIADIADLSAN